MNSVTSKYVQINDWCLVEYEYSTMSPKFLEYPTTGTDAIGIYRITNKLTGEYHFCNKADLLDGKATTGNSLEWNLLPYSSNKNKWASSDIIYNAILNPSDSKYAIEDLSTTIHNDTLYYDTIRFHVISGYNFEGIDGFIAEVNFLENSGKRCAVSASAYLRDMTHGTFSFNPNPIMLGERMYDKYITIMIPSLYRIQEEYNGTNQTLFGNLYSHPVLPNNPYPGGLLKDSTVYITLNELISDDTEEGVDFYTLNQKHTATVATTDMYSVLSCVIEESTNGDYFEYYPMWGDEFIVDYINSLNINATWSVIHNIKVVEQVGTTLTTTTDITIPQNTGFSAPSYFRPIIINAANAFSYSLLYTMRLINQSSGEQVIRVCNITKTDPKKYGLNLKRIKIDDGLQPMKVYNKIEELAIMQNTSTQVRSENMFSVKYVPRIVVQNSIALNLENSVTSTFNDVIFGQGKCVLQLTPFDNVFKFKVLNIVKTEVLPMNISNYTIYLNFIMDNKQTISISSTKSDEVNGSNGEIMFTISKEDSEKILNIKSNNAFYIVNKSNESDYETVIYKGKFELFTEGNSYDKEFMKPIELLLAEYKQKMDSLIKENEELQKTLKQKIDATVSPVTTTIAQSSQSNQIKNPTNPISTITPVSKK
jgi:hypothetical protein